MRKRPLLWFACVFLSGLAFERYESMGLLLIPLLVIGEEIYFGVKHKANWKVAGRSLILLSAFLLGMWHMEAEESFRTGYMRELDSTSKEVIVWGQVQEIKHTDYGVRMRLSDCCIRLRKQYVPCNDVLVYASSTHFQVGEIHKIKGQLNRFESARNEGNFNSLVFYQSQKIDFAVWLESSQKIGVRESAVRDFLLALKIRLLQVLQYNMDESASGFFSGVLLGDKTNLAKEVKDLFELGGISHILAISGLHVSMIGRNFYRLLRKCGCRFVGAGILAAGLLLLYGYIVGNSMSAVRAIGMMLIFFLGQCMGRSYDMLNALGAMVLVLMWDNPFLLEYSGFWFSVMALIGVGFVGDTFSKAFESDAKGIRKSLFKIKSGLMMSLGITIATLPVVASCYYEIPLYSILVNAVTLPILTPIFLLAVLGVLMGLISFAGGVIGSMFSILSKIILLPCSWGFGFYIWLCERVAKLPFAQIVCGKPQGWIVVVYYVLLAIGVILIQKLEREASTKRTQDASCEYVRKSRRLIYGISLMCLCIILCPKSKPFEITFLDVGQGDAIYITTGDGTTYFIDGGSTSEESVGEYCVLPFLKSKGVSHIDYWFVSHADNDHISGIFEVLKCGYEIGCLVMSKYAPADENMLQLISTTELYGVQVIYMDAGDKIMSDVASFTCLHPWDASMQDKNEASLVLKFEVNLERCNRDCVISVAGEKVSMKESVLRAIFAGDISSETEQLLLEKGVVDNVWLYKASHHGSKYSNSSELLEALKPEISVISCSLRNVYGHPHEEAICRIEAVGCKLFYTMENGQVTIRLLQ